jgi:hypothetical protein
MRLVRIRSLVGDVLAIKKIETADACISARIVSAAQNSADYTEIEISITVPKGKRFLSGDVVLLFSNPVSYELRIPVTTVRLGSSSGEKRPE